MLTHAAILAVGKAGYGNRIAVSFGDRELSYAELDRVTTTLARGLLSGGVQSGERVAWINSNHLDFLLLYYATAKAGVMFSALNPQSAPDEIRAMLDSLDPAMVVADPPAAQQCRLLGYRAIDHGSAEWSGLFEEGPPLPAVSEHTPHEIVFTSGTTSRPKGVWRSQRKRILDSLAAAVAYRLNRDDHMLFFAPQFHIGGSAAAAQMLVQGGRVTLLPRFDPVAIAQAIGSGATYMLGVPAHYQLLIDSGALTGVPTGTLRGCYLGGSVATPDLFSAIRTAFPAADIVHGYGSTEAGPHVMAARGDELIEHPGTLGLPVPGVEVRVVDTSGIDVEDDSAGELWVRSDTLMDGYWGEPELSQAVLTDGWLRTGDVVRRGADGFFYLVDRLKEMIITGGENVYPAEVEAALTRVPGVTEAAVIGVPDPVYEERVIAFVVPDGSRDLTPDGLSASLTSSLASYKIPRAITIVDTLPRTPLGKVAKAMLRVQFGSVFEQDAGRPEPDRSDVER